MIYELRTYTLKPGTAPIVAKNSGTVARDIRGDEYGKLEGYWLTEIGPLNQVMHLWSYADLNDRAEKRAALSQNSRWSSEYLPLVRDHMIRQDIRLLNQVVGPKAPEGEGNIYELRNYRLRPGASKTWCGHFQEGLVHREKYSKIVGLWTTEAGQPNEVCHIWAYPSLEARAKARGAAAADPGWQAFLKKSGPMIEEMWSTVMLPSAHSPMK
ncbi:MAG: NIPSNAP family protein [Alphaproteobacteria bacterium]